MKPIAFILSAILLRSTPGWAAPSGIKQLILAQDLFSYGVEMGDPLAVLTAAKITAAIPVTDTTLSVDTRPGKAATIPPKTEENLPPSTADMFAIATELASGDNYLLGLIADAKAEGHRGAVDGASRTLNRLQAGYVDMVKIAFKGGELAELAILGSEKSNLDLKITDTKGNIICAEHDLSDKLYCAWTPESDGDFYAEIENLSDQRNSYYLLTN